MYDWNVATLLIFSIPSTSMNGLFCPCPFHHTHLNLLITHTGINRHTTSSRARTHTAAGRRLQASSDWQPAASGPRRASPFFLGGYCFSPSSPPWCALLLSPLSLPPHHQVHGF
jgi:hypothetical protein